HIPAGNLAEQERRRRFAIGRAHDFAVRDGEGRQAGEAAAANDGKHETDRGRDRKRAANDLRGYRAVRVPRLPWARGRRLANWYSPSNHDIIFQIDGNRIRWTAIGSDRGHHLHIVARRAPQMYLDRLFKLMAEKQASDLFISCGAPISMKVNGVIAPLTNQPMDIDTVRRVAYELMSEDQARTFESEFEMNLSHL